MSKVNKQTSDTRMGTDPILPLIFKMSLPSMFSMLILALYNIVDSIYVSRLGEYALSALSLVYPIQMLNVAVGVGTGIGLASLISRKLGEQRVDEAQRAADHGVIIATFSWLIFAIFGLFGMRPFIMAFSDTPQLIDAACSYGTIVCLGTIFAFNTTNAERIMQACGNMMAPMFCSIAGCVANIILDPIMIFGLLGCPAMGVKGAAIATVIGQLIQMLSCFAVVNFANLPIRIKIRFFKPNMATIKQIYNVALPSMVMQSITSVTTLALNAILVSFSETAVAALGVYFKLQSFVFMPVFGMNQGVMPIMGYNYGAKNKKRLMETLFKSMLIAFIIMSLGTVLFQIFPEILMGFFDAQGDLLVVGVKALKTISLCFPFAAICIIIGALFQATGFGTYSMIVSIMRQIVVIIPAAFILSRIIGLLGVWYAYPIAEIMGLTISLILFKKLYNTRIKNMTEI